MTKPYIRANNVTYATVEQAAAAICQDRPVGDPSLEQFLMDQSSLSRQARLLCQIFENQRVLFLGDDDHLSPLLSGFSNTTCVVLEIDDRVIESLTRWHNRIPGGSLTVSKYDIRDPFPEIQRCDSFYLNPPYSSRTSAHGIKAWISRAMDGCGDFLDGIVVMPYDDHLPWVDHNWLEIQQFVTDNGFRILIPDNPVKHMYIDSNDQGLTSVNLHLRRVDQTRRKRETPRPGERLYR